MNLIEEDFQNKENNTKKTSSVILAAIIIVVMIIISLFVYLMYMDSTTMKLTIDGQQNDKVKSLLVFESDGKVYVPIKEIASHLGYESYNGEFTEKSEIQSKCYIQNENEVVNFQLGENKIYKLNLNSNNGNYEYEYIDKPVKAINGALYISEDGLEKAFNISFDYSKEANSVTIWTMPYLYQFYSTKILDYGYVELSSEFINQKSILKNQLIVLKDKTKNQYGVIGVDGKVILEAKYDNITYLPYTGDFLVQTNNKVGIISSSRETKVDIIYDSIELMDIDASLYVVKKDNKYGVIDFNGNIKIYIENDEIGIDVSKFIQNNIKNGYILAENLIPVRKDKFWGLYDKNGNQIVECKYDGLGYIASNNKDALNLLVIPNNNVIVAHKDGKYTIINSSGKELFPTVADDIYMSISGGQKHYYIFFNDQTMDAEEFMNSIGIKANSKDEATNKENANTNTNTNTTTNQENNVNNEEMKPNGENVIEGNNNQENITNNTEEQNQQEVNNQLEQNNQLQPNNVQEN